MLRVLHVVGGLSRNGAESVIMNYYRHVDRSILQFDFISHYPEHNDYEEEIRQLGGIIYYVPKFTGGNIITYINGWNNFFTNHREYSIIHSHAWSTASIYLPIAKKFGLYTISHSHSVSARSGVKAWGRSILRIPLPYLADYYMACSKAAARWLFGDRIFSKTNFSILPNAIDLSRYCYNPDVRRFIRSSYDVEDRFVIGHVGAFDTNKNQIFIIDLFNIINKIKSNTELWLVGGGPEIEKAKKKVLEYGLSESVVFWEVRDDVADLLQAMDLFLFPSHFESFGNAALEAQSAGLPVLCSDSIPREVSVSDMIYYLPLNQPEKWIDLIIKLIDNPTRCIINDELKGARFDINIAAPWLQNFYLEKG